MSFSHPLLLKKIQEACPELMALNFGCQLKREHPVDEWAKIYFILEPAGQGRPEGHYWISSSPFGSMAFVISKDLIENGGEFEILGHEPQLANVLRAIRNTPQYIRQKKVPFPSEIYNARHPLQWEQSVIERWNLSAGLYAQGEEVKNFLTQLLCEN